MSMDGIIQRSLVIFKPDTIQRGIIGELISRFERKGLKIVAMKLTQASRELAIKHYNKDEAWCEEIGRKYIRPAFEAEKIEFKWASDADAGRAALNSLTDYLSCGPVVVMVLEGGLAIDNIRSMVGYRNPIEADMGTIRADYTLESAYMANTAYRSVRNMIHASGAPDEAEYEIGLWFKPEELLHYSLAIDKILYDPEWEQVRKDITKGN
jgi:nucleoside-diphosphate kinase